VDAARGLRLTTLRPGHRRPMRPKRTLAAVMIASAVVLTGCAGTNTDVQRGETNCDKGSDNSHDEQCAQTGTPNPSDNT